MPGEVLKWERSEPGTPGRIIHYAKGNNLHIGNSPHSPHPRANSTFPSSFFRSVLLLFLNFLGLLGAALFLLLLLLQPTLTHHFSNPLRPLSTA